MDSDLPPRLRLALGALLVVAIVALAGCSYTPSSICPVCDDRLSNSAADRGVNVTVAESEFEVYLRSDGGARWEIRVRLDGEGVESFRTNDSLRRAVVRDRFANSSGPAPTEPRNLSIAMDGDTLVVSFDDPGLGDRHPGGVLAVDRFHYQSGPSPFTLRADRMAIHPPDGWVVLNEPPGASVQSDTVVWTRGVASGTYVVVGPDDSRATTAMGQVAVASEVASWAGGPWLASTVFPVVLLGVLLYVLLDRVPHEARSVTDHRVNHELVGTLAVTGVGLVAAAGVIVEVHGGIIDSESGALAVFVGLPALAFLVAGRVAHRRPVIRLPPAMVAVGCAPLVTLWLVLTTGGIGGLEALLTGVWAVVMVIVGSIAFHVGRHASMRPDLRPAADANQSGDGTSPPRRGGGHQSEGRQSGGHEGEGRHGGGHQGEGDH